MACLHYRQSYSFIETRDSSLEERNALFKCPTGPSAYRRKIAKDGNSLQSRAAVRARDLWHTACSFRIAGLVLVGSARSSRLSEERILLIDDGPGASRGAAWDGSVARCDEQDGLRALAERPSFYDLVVLAPRPEAREALLATVRAAAPLADVVVAVPAAERLAALPLLSRGAAALIDAPPERSEVLAYAARAAGHRAARAEARDQAALARALRATSSEEALPALLDAWAALLEPDCALVFGAAPGPGSSRLELRASREVDTPAPALPWLDDLVAHRPVPVILPVAEADLPPPPASSGPVLVVPIFHLQRLVGALVAVRRAPFEAADLERVAPLAACARLLLGVPHLQRALELSDRLATLGQLTAGVGHELRSPLAYVLDNALFLRDQLDKLADRSCGEPLALDGGRLRELRSSASDAVDGARRMSELLRDMAALASTDEATFVPVDLNEALRAAVRLTSPQLRHRAQVISRLDAELQVTGNVPRLTQVFVNLLVNAAQALEGRPGGEGRIVLTSRREGTRVVVEVSDNGPGIPAAVLPRIFDAFFTTKAPGEGTGLGLFLCRDIARAHRGALYARSSATRGSTFTLELPHASAAREAPAAVTPLPPVRLVAG